MAYGSPGLKTETINHFRELVMTQSLIEKVEQMRADVNRNIDNLSPPLRAMAGEFVKSVRDMSEILLDVADDLQELEEGLQELAEEVGEMKNGK